MRKYRPWEEKRCYTRCCRSKENTIYNLIVNKKLSNKGDNVKCSYVKNVLNQMTIILFFQ
jgi:hypothetical protein